MTYKLIYAVNSDNGDALMQYQNRLSLAGIQTTLLKSSDKCTYFEAVWDDTDVPEMLVHNKNPRNAGAKPKPLEYNDRPVTCGLIYALRQQKRLSDADIACLFDVSESTVARRRKKHLSDGSFFEGSNAVF